ncbi:HEAT repeat domain-containing protein [Bradyrhizobium sp. 83002]|uniref:HEAT repeat domain-containing protein n=1 Tax=Bradyrhizobium aeschynomenes TaxID=2734909 RepID=UPI001554C404|nr:HEAT repeat domain-containing protein [Bradyrhizobium aeschynomenes]NPU11909.1 HEAT repeat domain-containing protein [Bradyrhizobium aeschynomenes]
MPLVSMSLTHKSICALLTRDDTESLTLLRGAAASADQFIRRTAVEVIGRHASGRNLSDAILRALADQSEYVVRAGCQVIEDWRWDAAHDAISNLIKSPSGSTRQVSIRTLGAIWRQSDFQPVFQIYKTDAETEVRREAAWTLRNNVSSADWRRLFDAFRTDALPRHRRWACDLASTFGHSDVVPFLNPLCTDRDGHVRKAAAKAIAALEGHKLPAVDAVDVNV